MQSDLAEEAQLIDADRHVLKPKYRIVKRNNYGYRMFVVQRRLFWIFWFDSLIVTTVEQAHAAIKQWREAEAEDGEVIWVEKSGTNS